MLFQIPYYPGYKPTLSSPHYYIGVVGYVNIIFTFEKSKKGDDDHDDDEEDIVVD